jgi:hypothetical protein
VLGSLSTDLQQGARFGLASATFAYVILTEIGAQQGSSQEAETQKTTRPESGTAPAPDITGDTDSAPGPSARRPAGTHSLPHGFHPEESLVAVFVRSGRVILAARLDLSSEADADADGLAEFIDALAKREGAEALALVGYGAASLPTNRLLTQLMDRLVEQELTDVLYVGHGRWWSLTCADDCCPLAGTPLDLTAHQLSATAVLAGLGTRTNRRELEESVSGPAPDELPRLDAMVETMLAERAELADPGEAARLLVSMLDKVLADPNILDEESCLLLAFSSGMSTFVILLGRY